VANETNNLIFPIAIVASCLILGVFYYLSQQAVMEQKNLEYIADQKKECYSIYEREREKWTNVVGSHYDATRKSCVVTYKSDEPAKSEDECNKIIKNLPEDVSDQLKSSFYQLYADCLNNEFSKVF